MVEPWLMVYTVLAAWAACAAAASPRGHSIPAIPVGPMMTGKPRRSPNSWTDVSRSPAPLSGRGSRDSSPNASSLRRSVRSCSAAPSTKSNTMRGSVRRASARVAATL
jgi:hypothetical protein